MEPISLTKESLLILNIAGVNPYNHNLFSNLRIILTELSLGFVCVEVFLKCLYNWHGLASMQNIAVVVGTFQLMLKLLILAINRKRLIRILESIKYFWPLQNDDNELEQQVQILHSFVKSFTKVIFVLLMGFNIVYFVRPILSSERMLPFDTYHPNNLTKSPDFQIIYFIQYTFIAAVDPILMGFDMLFIALIVTVVCELKVLKREFSNLKAEQESISDNTQKYSFQQLIDHHNLILECIKDLEKVYSIILLCVIFLYMIGICGGLLAIITSGFPSNLGLVATYAFYVFFYVSQLFFYCVAGAYLTTQCEEISFAVYQCEWCEEHQLKFRRACALIIQRASRTEKLTAGGVFILNLENFTKVLRTGLSFFTFVKAVYEESN